MWSDGRAEIFSGKRNISIDKNIFLCRFIFYLNKIFCMNTSNLLSEMEIDPFVSPTSVVSQKTQQKILDIISQKLNQLNHNSTKPDFSDFVKEFVQNVSDESNYIALDPYYTPGFFSTVQPRDEYEHWQNLLGDRYKKITYEEHIKTSGFYYHPENIDEYDVVSILQKRRYNAHIQEEFAQNIDW